MPSLMLGRERFALPIGETRVGGVGADSLPFPALRRLPTLAVILVAVDRSLSLWPYGHDASGLRVDGVPLGAEPVPLAHGSKIEVSGVHLIVTHGSESGTTGPVAPVTRELLARPDAEQGDATIPDGAWLLRCGTTSAVQIPDSGLVIGRDADSDLVVSGTEVSRRHAIVRRSVRGYAVTDVSLNGTYVNGRRVQGAVLLRVGDVLRIGPEDFRFEAGRATHDPGATPPAPAAWPVPEPPTAIRSEPRIWQRLSKLWRQ